MFPVRKLPATQTAVQYLDKFWMKLFHLVWEGKINFQAKQGLLVRRVHVQPVNLTAVSEHGIFTDIAGYPTGGANLVKGSARRLAQVEIGLTADHSTAARKAA